MEQGGGCWGIVLGWLEKIKCVCERRVTMYSPPVVDGEGSHFARLGVFVLS